MNKYLIFGFAFGIVAQMISFMQLQMNIKFGWMQKWWYLILLTGIPATWLYIKAVEFFCKAFNGETWPGRLIGFGVGIIIFSLMSYLFFDERITMKNVLCICLALIIILIQILMK